MAKDGRLEFGDRTLQRALSGHFEPGERLVCKVEVKAMIPSLGIDKPFLLGLTNRSLYGHRRGKTWVLPLGLIRDVRESAGHDDLQSNLEIDLIAEQFDPFEAGRRFRIRISHRYSVKDFTRSIVEQLSAVPDTELEVEINGFRTVCRYWPWRPGCPPVAEVSSEALWSGQLPTPDETTELMLLSASKAFSEQEQPVKITDDWYRDPGTGEHLALRLSRTRQPGDVQAIPASMIDGNGNGIPMYLGFNSGHLCFIPQAGTLKTDPLYHIPWSEITTPSRIREGRNEVTGSSVSILDITLPANAPSILRHGLAASDDQTPVAVRFALKASDDAQLNRFVAGILKKLPSS